MSQSTNSVNNVKTWLFPSLVTTIGIMAGILLKDIKEDLAEVKSDIKMLMVQSNVDKTRIDNLERQIYKTTTKAPLSNFPEEPAMLTRYAVLPHNEIIKKLKYEKILF